jgi:hypothetical protein
LKEFIIHILSENIIGSSYHKCIIFKISQSIKVLSFLSELNTQITWLSAYEEFFYASLAIYQCTIHCNDTLKRNNWGGTFNRPPSPSFLVNNAILFKKNYFWIKLHCLLKRGGGGRLKVPPQSLIYIKTNSTHL